MTLLVAAFASMLLANPTPPADLVLVSAKVWTGDSARPEAQAFAVQDGASAAQTCMAARNGSHSNT